MAVLAWIAGLFAAGLGATLWAFRKGGVYNPVEAAVEPVPQKAQPPPLDFSTPKAAFHSVRVLCDEMGLTYEQKNILCACVYQESRFDNRAVGKNAKSKDWGIVQVNDKYNIGPGKPFPSIEYVVSHPEECVRWMIRIYKTTGNLQPWASFTSQAYVQWLPKHSPMWALAT